MLKPKTFKWKKTYKNKKEFYYSLISFGYLFIVESEIKEFWETKKKYHYSKTIYKAKMAHSTKKFQKILNPETKDYAFETKEDAFDVIENKVIKNILLQNFETLGVEKFYAQRKINSFYKINLDREVEQ